MFSNFVYILYIYIYRLTNSLVKVLVKAQNILLFVFSTSSRMRRERECHVPSWAYCLVLKTGKVQLF